MSVNWNLLYLIGIYCILFYVFVLLSVGERNRTHIVIVRTIIANSLAMCMTH